MKEQTPSKDKKSSIEEEDEEDEVSD